MQVNWPAAQPAHDAPIEQAERLSTDQGAIVNISRLVFVALLGATIGVGAGAQQPSATAAQKAAPEDCVRMQSKKHEHSADRGAGKMAMQPCAPAAGASAPAKKLRKTHDSRKPA